MSIRRWPAGFLKGWAEKLGAVSCGVTALRDYHVYSIKGRGPGTAKTSICLA